MPQPVKTKTTRTIFSLKNIFAFIIFTLIPIWYFTVAPDILKLPDNFTYNAEISSVDNFFDPSIGTYKGEQYSKTQFYYNVVGKQGNNLLIKNTFDVKTIDGKQIFKAEPVYGINPYTGQHVFGIGDKNRTGYLFAPRHLSKGDTFNYWHVSKSTTSKMKYISEEYLYGLRVYKFENSQDDTVDQTSVLSFLPDVGVTKGIRLKSTIHLWIEPLTGHLVKLEDYSNDYYYYDLKTGERLTPYNQFLNTFSEQSVKEHVNSAKLERYKVLVVDYYIPAILLLIVLIVVFSRFYWVQRIIKFFKTHRVILLITAIMLGLTSSAFIYVRINVFNQLQSQLYSDAKDINQKIEKRVNIYLNALNGGKALFETEGTVSRADWTKFVTSLQINENYPGLLGLGYAKVIRNDEKEKYINSIKKEGFPTFDITPETASAIYVPITYLEPFNAVNQEAFGYDMYSNIYRRRAMIKAAETNNIAASEQVVLLQDIDHPQPGFLLYLPLYSTHKTPTSTQERSKNLSGFVYAPLRVSEVMGSILDNDQSNLNLKIYDGLKINDASLIFNTDPNSTSDNEKNIIFHYIQTIYLADHPWTIEYTNNPNFKDDSYDSYLPWIVLVLATFMDLLLFLLIWSIAQSKKRAVEYAKQLTSDLENSKAELEKKNKKIEDKLKELDKTNRAMVDREMTMIDMKKELDKLKGNPTQK